MTYDTQSVEPTNHTQSLTPPLEQTPAVYHDMFMKTTPQVTTENNIVVTTDVAMNTENTNSLSESMDVTTPPVTTTDNNYVITTPEATTCDTSSLETTESIEPTSTI